MAFHDPIATNAPAFGERSNKVIAPGGATFGPGLSFPYPTNAWFIDFVLTGTTDMINSVDDRRTTVWPYLVRAQSDGLAFNKPFIREYPDGRTLRNEHQINYDVTATNWGWTSDSSPAIWRQLDLTFGAVEALSSYYLQSYDELSATLHWESDSSHYMNAPIVKGMPYVTMRYVGLTPVILTNNTDYHAIATINGAAPSGTVSGTRFVLTVNRPYLGTGATETWILYASTSISFEASPSGLTATAAFTGALRMAVVPTGSNAEISVLDSYQSTIPTSGHTMVAVTSDTATTTFSYATVGSGTLLMYSLPHHQATFDSPNYETLTITTIRGVLRAVKGSTWTTTQALSTVTWSSPNEIDSGKISAIQAALDSEKNLQASDLNATEAYLFGKQIARAARLVLIADQLGDTAARDNILTLMKPNLTSWLTSDSIINTISCLMYDTSWGGVIDMGAYTASPVGDPQNANQGFGNAVYNDHYFHWGYFIYAAAVIAKFDSAWAATNKDRVNAMIRDIANPSYDGDPYFTQFRHLDWYEGHSWAAGLQANGDGRNQESTSEAVNAWYGVNLWGLATGQVDLHNVGRYLQALETRAAQTYWQMPSSTTVYPADFASQKVIPLIFANKAFNGTWFGLTNDILVGIEAMPFTPASHELLPKSWMAETYPARLASVDTTSTAYTPGGWLGYTYASQAIIDPDSAYSNISDLAITNNNQYIDQFGASKTNLLWWSAVQGTVTAPTQTATTTTLIVSPSGESQVGATITLTATITPAISGGVVFQDGLSTIGNGVVTNGSAAITINTLAVGSHNLSAVFTPSDSADYLASTATVSAYNVIAAPPTGNNNGNLGASNSGSLSVGYVISPALTEERTLINDTNYTVTSQDSIIAFASITSARTVTLTQMAAGNEIYIKDESGQCSASNSITIVGSIDGVASITINSAYGACHFYSTGTDWMRIT